MTLYLWIQRYNGDNIQDQIYFCIPQGDRSFGNGIFFENFTFKIQKNSHQVFEASRTAFEHWKQIDVIFSIVSTCICLKLLYYINSVQQIVKIGFNSQSFLSSIFPFFLFRNESLVIKPRSVHFEILTIWWTGRQYTQNQVATIEQMTI